MENIGEYLLMLLQREGMSQRELAKQAQVSNAEISRIVSACAVGLRRGGDW
jgi:transcriptional regulator with XRE-family HTH domain